MILSTWVYKVRWTCSMCFVVYVTMTIYCGIQTIHHIHVHQHFRHMESSCVPFHMDNKGTLLQVHTDPQSPRHGESTPTPWLGSTHYVISSRWWPVSCCGSDCYPQPSRWKQVSNLNGSRRKRDRSSRRKRIHQHPPAPKRVETRRSWVSCSLRTHTCRHPLMSPGV